MESLNILAGKKGFVGPSFSGRNRLRRACWGAAWLLLARWTPPFCHRWRIAVLRLFGGQVSWRAYVYGDVSIWAPWNLAVDDYGTLARGVVVYNIAPVTIGPRAVVSQRATLCTGTHDHRDPAFPLVARPIRLGRRAWVCASAFVGPGVTVGDGAVLAGGGVALKDLAAWTVHVGNPAAADRPRPVIED